MDENIRIWAEKQQLKNDAIRADKNAFKKKDVCTGASV